MSEQENIDLIFNDFENACWDSANDPAFGRIPKRLRTHLQLVESTANKLNAEYQAEIDRLATEIEKFKEKVDDLKTDVECVNEERDELAEEFDDIEYNNWLADATGYEGYRTK